MKKEICDSVNRKIINKILDLLETRKYEKIVVVKVTYILEVFLSEFEKFIGLSVIFGMLHRFYDFLVAFVVLAMLRIYMGGTHRKTIFGCFLQSMVNILVIVFLSESIVLDTWFCAIIFIILFAIIWKIVPIQSKSRIQYTSSQRKKFKMKSSIVSAILLVLDIVLPVKYSTLIIISITVQGLDVLLAYFLQTKY